MIANIFLLQSFMYFKTQGCHYQYW